MDKKFFRTILGDKPVEQMGLTYSHEHIIIEDSYVTAAHPEFLLNDIEKVSKELISFREAGGETVVDSMPANAGRNALKMAAVSEISGVNIIVPTGIHLEIYYPHNHWRYSYTEDQLTDLFIADVNEGIDKYDYSGPFIERTLHKAGLIKIATGDHSFTKHQEKLFRAVVNTHKVTGVPILTHTNFGNQAWEQAKMFEKLGANLEHIVLSHVDRYKDLDYQKKVLDTGISVEYDSAFRWKANDHNWTLEFIEKLLPLYPEQITLGMDMAKNAYWKSYGGKPGLTYLLDTIPSFLATKGLNQYWRNIFFDTPKRIFAFSK